MGSPRRSAFSYTALPPAAANLRPQSSHWKTLRMMSRNPGMLRLSILELPCSAAGAANVCVAGGGGGAGSGAGSGTAAARHMRRMQPPPLPCPSPCRSTLCRWSRRCECHRFRRPRARRWQPPCCLVYLWWGSAVTSGCNQMQPSAPKAPMLCVARREVQYVLAQDCLPECLFDRCEVAATPEAPA